LVFYKTINEIFKTLNSWFKQNLLSLNLAKTHFITFISKNNNDTELDINFGDKSIYAITCTQSFFLKKMFRGTLSLTQENHHFIVQIGKNKCSQ
jgi:hypothetical protein